MAQPYRTAGTIDQPEPRRESLRLRRYPVWVQLFWLLWAPLVAAAVAQFYPGFALACEGPKGAPACTIEEARLGGAQRYALAGKHEIWIRDRELLQRASAEGAYVHVLVTATRIGAEEPPTRFTFELPADEVIALDAELRRLGDEVDALRVPLRSVDALYLACACGELAIALFFLARQRRIRIEVDVETGRVVIDERRGVREARRSTFTLDRVAALEMDRGGDSPVHGRRVFAVVDQTQEELFLAFDAEAARGLHFLERARAQARFGIGGVTSVAGACFEGEGASR